MQATGSEPLLLREDEPGDTSYVGAPHLEATAGLWSGASAVQRRLLLVCWVLLLVQWTLMTFMSSFFPLSGPGSGISPVMVGVVFSSLPLGIALASPFVGAVMRRLGVRRTLTAGCVAMALCFALFGAVPLLLGGGGGGGGKVREAAFVVTGLLYGAGSALAESGVYAALQRNFASQMGQVLSTTETVAGMGCMVGPFVGGVAFDALARIGALARDAELHFALPFLLAALMPLACALAVRKFVQGDDDDGDDNDDDDDASSSSAKKEKKREKKEGVAAAAVATYPAGISGTGGGGVATPFLLTAISALTSNALNPTLEVRSAAAPLSMGTSGTGALFLAMGFVYMGVSLPLGRLIDARPDIPLQRVMALGLLLVAMSYAMLGPLYVRGVVDLAAQFDSVGAVVVAMLAQGAGGCMTCIPCLPAMLRTVDQSDADASAAITGLWVSAYSIGSALGTLIGSSLLELRASAVCRAATKDVYVDGHVDDRCFDGFCTTVAAATLACLGLLLAQPLWRRCRDAKVCVSPPLRSMIKNRN